MADRRREILFALALLVTGLVGFAALEWAAQAREARIAARTVDWAGLAKAAASERVSGMMLFKPGTRFGNIRLNSQGFRGPDVPVPTPASTVRIVFLGDSKMFAAELTEEQTPSAQTIAMLKTLRPECRFDYVTIAGPGYTLPLLSRLLKTRAPKFQPDIAVVLAGSAIELVNPPGSTSVKAKPGEPVPFIQGGGTGGFGALLVRSAALRLMRSELSMISPSTQPSSQAGQPIEILALRYRDMLHALDYAAGNMPVVAIAYRSRGVAPNSISDKIRSARRTFKKMPGISLKKADALAALVVSETAQHARKAGWRYIDPVAEIETDGRNFTDQTHFSAQGATHVAADTSAEISTLIGPGCSVPKRSRASTQRNAGGLK